MNPDSIRPSLSFSPEYQSSVDNWHPHRPFAYDLMTAANPEIFVELGVHWGDSYFTFCQTRKEQNFVRGFFKDVKEIKEGEAKKKQDNHNFPPDFPHRRNINLLI